MSPKSGKSNLESGTAPSEMLDHRIAERLDIELPLAFRCTHEDEAWPATTVDISGGGLRFTSPTPIQKGDTCEVELSVPDHKRALRFSGYIVRCDANSGQGDSFTVAVQFNQRLCDKTTFALFSQFIAKQLLIKYLG